MLVVVHDRNVDAGSQALFDLEAARRGDVGQRDAAEHRRDVLHDAHDLVGILCRQT